MEDRSNLSLSLLLPDLENFGLQYRLSAHLSPAPPNSNCCKEVRILLSLLSPQESSCSVLEIPQTHLLSTEQILPTIFILTNMQHPENFLLM